MPDEKKETRETAAAPVLDHVAYARRDSGSTLSDERTLLPGKTYRVGTQTEVDKGEAVFTKEFAKRLVEDGQCLYCDSSGHHKSVSPTAVIQPEGPVTISQLQGVSEPNPKKEAAIAGPQEMAVVKE